MIDLRSDTVTKPTPNMLEAMLNAEVGDDVFQEDPTVIKLEKKCASMFGMEAAIFCPSGTMTNQIGIHILSNPYEEVICYKNAHIYKYEGGGIAGNSGLSFALLEGNNGILDATEIADRINPDDIHFPKTTVLALENTVNKGGGNCYSIKQIREIHQLCTEKGLKMHLDGARLFNALVKTSEQAQDYGKIFDTISVCLSKGLGAPVGSLLLGNKELIKKARRVRKYFGGGMRQAGYLAAAGIYALDHHVERLTEDHRRAQILGDAIGQLDFVEEVLPVETNIVIVRLSNKIAAEDCLQKLKEMEILAVPFGKHDVRFVTHLDFDDEQLDQTITRLKSLSI
ncbi:MAG: GntG family PLP-dependent aldolase [Fulvivirga sp.]|nr:GntG family PLP-dependent aldolase [Fulvivirga sp.]